MTMRGSAGEPAARRETGTPAEGLTFPDLPRMELDDLLRQLEDRAQEVIGTQGRPARSGSHPGIRR
jgi:hypothetical protein